MTLEWSLVVVRDRSCVCLGPGLFRHVLRLRLWCALLVLLRLTFFEDTDAAASTGCMSLVVDNCTFVSLVVDNCTCVLGCGQFREPVANVSLVVD